MLHPLFSTVIQRPDLIADHVSAYAALFGQELKTIGEDVFIRLLAWLLFILCGFLFLCLTGIALMLGLMQNQFHWILVAAPALALLTTVMAFLKARRPLPSDYFPELKAQIDSDVDTLKMAT